MEFKTTTERRTRGGKLWVAVTRELTRLRSQHCACEITASDDGVEVQGWPVMTPVEALEFAQTVIVAAAMADEIAAGNGARLVADLKAEGVLPC